MKTNIEILKFKPLNVEFVDALPEDIGKRKQFKYNCMNGLVSGKAGAVVVASQFSFSAWVSCALNVSSYGTYGGYG